jgi:TonB family protein
MAPFPWLCCGLSFRLMHLAAENCCVPGLAERQGRTTRTVVTCIAAALVFAGSAQSALSGQPASPRVVFPAGCAPPAWPDSTVRFGEPPSVDVELLIDVTGAVLKTKIVTSSGSRKFDDAARVALARCSYPPVVRAGKAVPGWIRVHYKWVVE